MRGGPIHKTDRSREHWQHAFNLYTQLNSPEAEAVHQHLARLSQAASRQSNNNA